MLWAAFCAEGFARWTARLPMAVRVAAPGLLCLVYALVAMQRGIFEWRWFAVYLLLPVAVAAMLAWAAEVDPGQRGDWRSFVVLLVLGLAVDLRWFEPAWPRDGGVQQDGAAGCGDLGIWGGAAIGGCGVRSAVALAGCACGGAGIFVLCAGGDCDRVWRWGFCMRTRSGRDGGCRLRWCSRSSLLRCRRSCSFGDGCRICWSGEWGAGGRWA